MSIPEQLRKIFKVAPNFPIKMIFGMGLLIGTVIVIFKGFEGLATNWKEETAHLTEHNEIQERTREGKQEYFYKTYYNFTVNDQRYRVTKEQGHPTREEAKIALEQEIQQSITPVWYSSWNPNKATLTKNDTKWYFYFLACIPALLALAYLRWLFLKYCELEIEK